MFVLLIASASIPWRQSHREVCLFLEEADGHLRFALQKWESPRTVIRLGPWISINFRGLWTVLRLMNRLTFTCTTYSSGWRSPAEDACPTGRSRRR